MLALWIVLYPILESKMVSQEICAAEKKTNAPVSQISTKKLFWTTGLFIIIPIAGLSRMVDNAVKLLTPTMLMESYENLPAAISTRLSVILVVFAAMGIFLGRFLRKKFTDNEMKLIAILIAVSIPLIGFTYFVGKSHYLAVLLTLSIGTVFLEGAIPFTSSFVAARYTEYGRNGTVSGIINAIQSAGNIMASFLFPAISENTSWNAIALIWVACLFTTVVLCICVLPAWTRFIEKSKKGV